jgi:hypothetical protein
MKEAFDRMNAHIRPDAGLNSRVLDQIAAPAKTRRNFRPLAAVAAMLVLIILATPVMAGHTPLVNDLLYTISPELAEHYAPVQLSDTDQGITLEVMAAKVTDSSAEFVVRLEGEALAGKIVGPNLTIKDFNRNTRISAESLNDYEGLQEDRENGIWYYRYVVTYPDGTPVTKILRDNITVKLSLIYLDEVGQEDGVEIPIIFTDYEQRTVKYDRVLKDYGFSHFGGRAGFPEEFKLMTPGKSAYDATDRLSLTGAAYIDDLLHIQIAAKDVKINNKIIWSHFTPHLQDEEGNKMNPVNYYFFGIEKDGRETDYTEVIFDIPESELEHYTLRVKTMDSDTIFPNCKVTFRISDLEYTTE